MDENKDEKDVFDYLRPFTLRYVKPGIDWVFQNRIHAIVSLIVFALLLLLLNMIAGLVKHVLIISFLILLGGVSKIYQRFFKVQLGIEFIMLTTVVSGYVYGPFVGAVVGLFTFALSTYFSGFFSHTLALSFVLIAFVGFFSSFFEGTSIKTAGITLTLIYNLIFVPIYVVWFRGRLTRIFLFSITHIIWNIWVFSTIAPYLLKILS